MSFASKNYVDQQEEILSGYIYNEEVRQKLVEETFSGEITNISYDMSGDFSVIENQISLVDSNKQDKVPNTSTSGIYGLIPGGGTQLLQGTYVSFAQAFVETGIIIENPTGTWTIDPDFYARNDLFDFPLTNGGSLHFYKENGSQTYSTVSNDGTIINAQFDADQGTIVLTSIQPVQEHDPTKVDVSQNSISTASIIENNSGNINIHSLGMPGQVDIRSANSQLTSTQGFRTQTQQNGDYVQEIDKDGNKFGFWGTQSTVNFGFDGAQNRIQNVANPINANDVATKQYVDQISGSAGISGQFVTSLEMGNGTTSKVDNTVSGLYTNFRYNRIAGFDDDIFIKQGPESGLLLGNVDHQWFDNVHLKSHIKIGYLDTQIYAGSLDETNGRTFIIDQSQRPKFNIHGNSTTISYGSSGDETYVPTIIFSGFTQQNDQEFAQQLYNNGNVNWATCIGVGGRGVVWQGANIDGIYSTDGINITFFDEWFGTAYFPTGLIYGWAPTTTTKDIAFLDDIAQEAVNVYVPWTEFFPGDYETFIRNERQGLGYSYIRRAADEDNLSIELQAQTFFGSASSFDVNTLGFDFKRNSNRVLGYDWSTGWDFNNTPIHNVPNPSGNLDAQNKQYVDGQINDVNTNISGSYVPIIKAYDTNGFVFNETIANATNSQEHLTAYKNGNSAGIEIGQNQTSSGLVSIIGGETQLRIWKENGTKKVGYPGTPQYEIWNILDPTSGQNAATKHYVDESIQEAVISGVSGIFVPFELDHDQSSNITQRGTDSWNEITRSTSTEHQEIALKASSQAYPIGGTSLNIIEDGIYDTWSIEAQHDGDQKLIINDDGISQTVPLMLSADPTEDLEQATKQYVDNNAGDDEALRQDVSGYYAAKDIRINDSNRLQITQYIDNSWSTQQMRTTWSGLYAGISVDQDATSSGQVNMVINGNALRLWTENGSGKFGNPIYPTYEIWNIKNPTQPQNAATKQYVDNSFNTLSGLLPTDVSDENPLVDKNYVDDSIEEVVIDLSVVSGKVYSLETKVPTEQSSTNQLADKQWVSQQVPQNYNTLSGKVYTIETEIPSNASSSNKLQTIQDVYSGDIFVDGKYSGILPLIPSAQTSTNQLADKQWVDTQISEQSLGEGVQAALYVDSDTSNWNIISQDETLTETQYALDSDYNIITSTQVIHNQTPPYSYWLIPESSQTGVQIFVLDLRAGLTGAYDFDKDNCKWVRSQTSSTNLTDQQLQALNSTITQTKVTQYDNYQTGKQDALTSQQLQAVNSNITQTKVTQYDGYQTGKQDALTQTGTTNLLTQPAQQGGQPGTYQISNFATQSALANKQDQLAAGSSTNLLTQPTTLGGQPGTYQLSNLATTSDLANKQNKIPYSSNGYLLTEPSTDGGNPGTIDPSTFLTSSDLTGLQTQITGSANGYLLTQPSSTGGQPGTVDQSTFATQTALQDKQNKIPQSQASMLMVNPTVQGGNPGTYQLSNLASQTSVANKVDKIETGTSLYAYTHEGQTQGQVGISDSAGGNNLARYKSDGNLEVGNQNDPITNLDYALNFDTLNKYLVVGSGLQYDNLLITQNSAVPRDYYGGGNVSSHIQNDGYYINEIVSGNSIYGTMQVMPDGSYMGAYSGLSSVSQIIASVSNVQILHGNKGLIINDPIDGITLYDFNNTDGQSCLLHNVADAVDSNDAVNKYQLDNTVSGYVLKSVNSLGHTSVITNAGQVGFNVTAEDGTVSLTNQASILVPSQQGTALYLTRTVGGNNLALSLYDELQVTYNDNPLFTVQPTYISAGNQRIQEVSDPVNATDVATKQYVDNSTPSGLIQSLPSPNAITEEGWADDEATQITLQQANTGQIIFFPQEVIS